MTCPAAASVDAPAAAAGAVQPVLKPRISVLQRARRSVSAPAALAVYSPSSRRSIRKVDLDQTIALCSPLRALPRVVPNLRDPPFPPPGLLPRPPFSAHRSFLLPPIRAFAWRLRRRSAFL